MKLRKIHKYIRDPDRATIEFIPFAGAPGFTHRVVINRVAVDWLGDQHKPNRAAAIYYLDKHKPAIEATKREPATAL